VDNDRSIINCFSTCLRQLARRTNGTTLSVLEVPVRISRTCPAAHVRRIASVPPEVLEPFSPAATFAPAQKDGCSKKAAARDAKSWRIGGAIDTFEIARSIEGVQSAPGPFSIWSQEFMDLLRKSILVQLGNFG
jgi:hypothetical protein